MSLYPNIGQLNLNSDLAVIPKSNNSNNHNEQTSIKDVSLSALGTNKSLYPVLAEYMGLDISQQLSENNALVKPDIIQPPVPAVPGQVTQGLRRLVLCKDAKGRIGLLVSAVNNGIFVCFVLKDSPAAMIGLRFGDQILQINDTLLAGFTADKVHNLIKKCPVNNINFIVRDRPFERNVTMHKDNIGKVGFEFKNSKIIALVKDSSAARNGLVTDHHLLEVEGQNVIGMSDKEISKILEKAGNIVTVTIIPSFLYEQMMKKMRADYVKAKMDHSVHI